MPAAGMPVVPDRDSPLVLPHGGNRRYSIRTGKKAWIGSCLNEKGLIKGNERGESACGAINGNPGTGITDTGRPSGGNAQGWQKPGQADSLWGWLDSRQNTTDRSTV